MNSLEDRHKIAYRKALDEGRKILIQTCKVLLGGVPVADKFIGLSQGEKKRLGFNTGQIKKIESKCSLDLMDISLLDAIICAFGNLPDGNLRSLLKELKTLRNELSHEDHIIDLTKKSLLITRLDTLKILYRSILEELKNNSNPASIHYIPSDQDICDVEARLVDLAKTLDDYIQEETVKLCKAAKATNDAVATVQEETIKLSEATKATGDAAKVTTDAAKVTTDAATTIEESTTILKAVINKVNEVVSDLNMKSRESNTTFNENQDEKVLLKKLSGKEVISTRSFDSSEPDELPFKKNDVLTIVNKDNEQWWTAKNKMGQTGSIPASYVKEIVLRERVVARGDWEASEDDELSFKKHDVLTIVDKDEEYAYGWWTAINAMGQSGFVPGPYVQENFYQPWKGGSMCRVVRSCNPEKGGIHPSNLNEGFWLTLTVGDIIHGLAEVSEGRWKGILNGQEGLFKSNFVEEISDAEATSIDTTSSSLATHSKPMPKSSKKGGLLKKIFKWGGGSE